jgi:octaprenyl-diphosphate synthase
MIDRGNSLLTESRTEEGAVRSQTEVDGEVHGGSFIAKFRRNVSGPTTRYAVSSESKRGQIDVSGLELWVDDQVQAVERLISRAISSRYPQVNNLCEHAASMGGKRLRPRLALLSAAACTGTLPSCSKNLVRVGAAVELVHAASLVHDDVMDSADIRRHKPTIGKLAGSDAAILLGDYLFTKAYALASQCGSPVPATRLAASATSLCEGELRQQLMSEVWGVSISEYKSVLCQKTGALCAVSCYLGAWSRRKEDRLAKTHARDLYRFGMQLGLAFQIYDDWLDYWGTDQVGKTLATDLEQQKPTLPVLRLLATASESESQDCLALLRSDLPHQEKLTNVLKLLNQSDASEYTLAAARKCAERALGCLQSLPVSPAVEALAAIAQFSVNRKS